MKSCATPVRFVGGPKHNKVYWTNLQAYWKVSVPDDCYCDEFNANNIATIHKQLFHFEYYKLVVGRTEYGTQYYEYHHEKHEEPDSVWSVSYEAVELLPSLFYFDETWIEKYAKKRRH
mgnify:FL=1